MRHLKNLLFVLKIMVGSGIFLPSLNYAQSPALYKIEYTVIDNKAKERIKDLPVANKELLLSFIQKQTYSFLINKHKSLYYHSNYSIYRDKDKKVWLKSVYLNGNHYLVVYDSIPLKWKITGEQQKIGGFIAYKAIGIYQDDPVTAWFTPEIPLDGGPELFHGLPGLILALKWNGRTYTATKIQSTQEKIMPPPEDTTPISDEEFKRRIKQGGMTIGGENGGMQIIIMKKN